MRLQRFKSVHGVCEFMLVIGKGTSYWRLTAYTGSGRDRRYLALERLLVRKTLAERLARRGIAVERIEFNDGQCCIYPTKEPHFVGRTTQTVVTVLAENYPQYQGLSVRWKVWDGKGI